MKFRILILLLAVLLLLGLSGCSLARRIDAAEDMVEDRMGAVEDSVENAIEGAIHTGAVTQPSAQPAGRLTREQAQTIALDHAGFTADQVTYLRTEFEIDDGIPQYEVQFHQGPWEYDYEINADTGDILSYDRDD